MPPADEQPHREEGDQRRDRRLRAPLYELGEVALREEDRHTEDHERDRVAEAPGGAEPGGGPRRALASGDDEGRHGGEMIRVGRVPEPEEDRDQQHDRDRPLVRHPCDPLVEPEHHALLRSETRLVRREGIIGSATLSDRRPGSRAR